MTIQMAFMFWRYQAMWSAWRMVITTILGTVDRRYRSIIGQEARRRRLFGNKKTYDTAAYNAAN